MERSEQINEIAKALCKARLDIEPLLKDTKGYNYSYAQLDQVLDKIIPAFSNQGLSIAQFPFNKNGEIGIETILMHESGQFLTSEFGTAALKKDCQSIGSQITYYRRYSLMSICGIAPQDDDGVKAMPAKQILVKKNYPSFDMPTKPNPEYMMLTGKYKGKKLAEIDREELVGYFEALKGAMKGKEDQMSQVQKQLFKNLELFLGE